MDAQCRWRDQPAAVVGCRYRSLARKEGKGAHRSPPDFGIRRPPDAICFRSLAPDRRGPRAPPSAGNVGKCRCSINPPADDHPGRYPGTGEPQSAARHAQTRDLYGRAAVHDDPETGALGAPRGGPVDDPELQPNRLGADRDRLVDGAPGKRAAAKDIDHVDRLGDIGERSVATLAEDHRAGGKRVDRDRPVALVLQIAHDAVARPVGPRAGADDRDGPGFGQDRAQIIVEIAEIGHRAGYRAVAAARRSKSASAASSGVTWRPAPSRRRAIAWSAGRFVDSMPSKV